MKKYSLIFFMVLLISSSLIAEEKWVQMGLIKSTLNNGEFSYEYKTCSKSPEKVRINLEVVQREGIWGVQPVKLGLRILNKPDAINCNSENPVEVKRGTLNINRVLSEEAKANGVTVNGYDVELDLPKVFVSAVVSDNVYVDPGVIIYQ